MLKWIFFLQHCHCNISIEQQQQHLFVYMFAVYDGFIIPIMLLLTSSWWMNLPNIIYVSNVISTIFNNILLFNFNNQHHHHYQHFFFYIIIIIFSKSSIKFSFYLYISFSLILTLTNFNILWFCSLYIALYTYIQYCTNASITIFTIPLMIIH